MLHKIVISLDSGIFDFANLFTVEFFPFLAIKFQVKVFDKLGISEVDKSISKIAKIAEINGQVEEVIFAFVILINSLSNQRQVIFVGDIPDHHSCSSTCLKLINIDIIKVSFFSFLGSSLGSCMVLVVIGVGIGSVGLGRRSCLASVVGRSGIGNRLVHHVEIIVKILWNNEKLFEHIRTRRDVEVLVDKGLRSSGTKGAKIVVGEGVLQEIIVAGEG